MMMKMILITVVLKKPPRKGHHYLPYSADPSGIYLIILIYFFERKYKN